MSKSQFSNDLSKMQNAWNESQAQYDSTWGGVKVDPGQYTARLSSIRLHKSNMSGKVMILRQHTIIEGDWEGHVVQDYMGLSTAQNLSFVRRYVDQMGFTAPDNTTELEDLLMEMNKSVPTCRIQVKHSGDFVNVYLIERLDVSAEKIEEDEEDEEVDQTEKYVDDEVEEDVDNGESDESDESDQSNEVDEELRKRLVAFCQAQDVECSEDDSADVLCDSITEFDWPEEELSEEEIKMFESANISDAIKRKPKPKTKPVAKKKTAAKRRSK